MAKITTEKHVHKFKRLKYKTGSTIFFCTLPDCSVKLNPALALGKRSICWRCGEPFVMTEYSLRLAKPHCENCHKPKNGIPREETHSAPLMPIESLTERLNRTINMTLPSEVEDEL
jgi:hypothetical protein